MSIVRRNTTKLMASAVAVADFAIALPTGMSLRSVQAKIPLFRNTVAAG